MEHRQGLYPAALCCVILGILLAPLMAQEEHTKASWYGQGLDGHAMANGKPFNPHALTCASWDYKLGTYLVVRHDNKFVVVEVTDRGPCKPIYRRGITIDLSRAAFEALSPLEEGIIKVVVEPLHKA